MRILFVCHGNICRSVMAEMVMKYLLQERHIDGVEVASCATSTEEIGNEIYPPAKACLRRHNIPFTPHSARQIMQTDYDHYDRIVCMDNYNIRNLRRVLGSEVMDADALRPTIANDPFSGPKIRKLLTRDVADPWYTDDFETTYRDIVEGCEALLAGWIRVC